MGVLVAVPGVVFLGTQRGPPRSIPCHVPCQGSSPAPSMENFILPSPLGCSFPTTSHARPGLSKINPVATVTQSRDAKYTEYRYLYIYLTATHAARAPEQGTRSPTGSEPCRPRDGSRVGRDPWQPLHGLEMLIPARIQPCLGSPGPTWWLCLHLIPGIPPLLHPENPQIPAPGPCPQLLLPSPSTLERDFTPGNLTQAFPGIHSAYSPHWLGRRIPSFIVKSG